MGVLALVAVAAYGPILSLLIQLYENAFYYTCAGIQYGLTEFLTNYVSPLMLAYTFAGNYAAGTHHRILCFIVVLVLAEGILGYLVYVKRKSESAGKAFAFSWTRGGAPVSDRGARPAWNRDDFLSAPYRNFQECMVDFWNDPRDYFDERDYECDLPYGFPEIFCP